MKALIIIDMLEDFVHGALANPQAVTILEPLERLLEYARSDGWVIVFSSDAHERGDPELSIWGEHAMAGTLGASVVHELDPSLGRARVHLSEARLRRLRRHRSRSSGYVRSASTRSSSWANTRISASVIPHTGRFSTIRNHRSKGRGLRVCRRRRGGGTRVPPDRLRRQDHDRRRAGRQRRGAACNRSILTTRSANYRAGSVAIRPDNSTREER